MAYLSEFKSDNITDIISDRLFGKSYKDLNFHDSQVVRDWIASLNDGKSNPSKIPQPEPFLTKQEYFALRCLEFVNKGEGYTSKDIASMAVNCAIYMLRFLDNHKNE